MRIVIAGQTYYPGNNGQAVFTIRLAEGLAKLGHDVAMIVPAEEFRTRRAVKNGVLVLSIAALHLKNLHDNAYFPPAPMGAIKKLFKTFKPDIVHLQDHYPLSRVVYQVAKKHRVPVMGTNHFLPENVMPYLPIPQKLHGVTKWLLWYSVLSLYNKLDYVTTPTATAASIIRGQALRVPVKPVSCGVDIQRFHPDTADSHTEMRLKYGLSPKKTILFYVGRIDAEKRLDVMIRALKKLGRTDVQFAIAGKGEHRPALEALTAELGLAEQVAFLGFVPDDDLPALINSIDIFAMPSEAELQSIATLEAMASGKPVIAANARALPELVETGVNGYLFRAGDIADAAHGLQTLLDHRADWVKLGAASREKAQPHGLENTIRRYESLYFQLNPNAQPVKHRIDKKGWVSI